MAPAPSGRVRAVPRRRVRGRDRTGDGPPPGVDVDRSEEFLDAQRAAWGAGEFDWVARRLWPAGGSLVRRLGVTAGDAVVDVGCGTGNAAIQAAQAGGDVTGVDLSPEMLAQADAAARAAGLTIRWTEGDAEALPLPDGSADVVMSTFGCMFAPRHRVAAGEILRVLRPGGRFGVCAWTPDSEVAAFLQVMARHVPDPPWLTEPPILWGDPEHVREIFGAGATDLRFAREAVGMDFDSLDHALMLYTERFGPLLAARAELEPEGRWEPLVDDMRAFLAERVEPDGTIPLRSVYLMSTGHRAPA